jgi:hypothetical protein
VVVELLRGLPEALCAIEDDRETFGNKGQAVALGQLAEAFCLVQSDLRSPRFLL